MICIRCKKNQATKTYERALGGGKVREEYYCLACYHRAFLSPEPTEKGEKTCPYCGRTSAEVKKTSLVGCAKCYETLRGAVMPMLTKMQGMEAHQGKTAAATTEEELLEMRLKELLTLISSYKQSGDSERAKSCYDEYNRLSDILRGEGENGKYTGIY